MEPAREGLTGLNSDPEARPTAALQQPASARPPQPPTLPDQDQAEHPVSGPVKALLREIIMEDRAEQDINSFMAATSCEAQKLGAE
jgi:hypothetical protein